MGHGDGRQLCQVEVRALPHGLHARQPPDDDWHPCVGGLGADLRTPPAGSGDCVWGGTAVLALRPLCLENEALLPRFVRHVLGEGLCGPPLLADGPHPRRRVGSGNLRLRHGCDAHRLCAQLHAAGRGRDAHHHGCLRHPALRRAEGRAPQHGDRGSGRRLPGERGQGPPWQRPVPVRGCLGHGGRARAHRRAHCDLRLPDGGDHEARRVDASGLPEQDELALAASALGRRAETQRGPS
mmetsp:Transcript_26195/g.82219  ORF Transcript_26195/g.82219 Transcript_26195/m.82219 type:complete len:239 (+) Transcript_26195:192-908(+)